MSRTAAHTSRPRAADRHVTPAIELLMEPMLLRKRSVLRLLDMPARSFDRLVASGGFPPPDKRIGRSPRWRLATVRDWAEGRAEVAR